jgi:hypothetical protein
MASLRSSGVIVTSLIDYRLPEHRRDGFKLYYRNAVLTGDLDPMFALIRDWPSDFEHKVWLAFLYSCCLGHAGTTFAVASLPMDSLADWAGSHFNPLPWKMTDHDYTQTKRKAATLVGLIESYRSLLAGRTQAEWLESLIEDDPGGCSSGDPGRTFRNVYQAICSIKGVGRFCGLDFCEVLARSLGLPLACFDPNLLIRAPHPRAGLAKVLGLDPTSGEDVLNLGLQALMNEIPGSDIMSMETVCCSYKNLCKGKRYTGYYIDDTADQLTSAEEWAALAVPGFDWVKLWDIFRVNFPNAAPNIQTARLRLFLETGCL